MGPGQAGEVGTGESHEVHPKGCSPGEEKLFLKPRQGWSHSGEQDQDVTAACSGCWHGDKAFGSAPACATLPKIIGELARGRLSAAAALSSRRPR